ncbi:MAG: thioredoxin [Eggerthellaceae bacterium]|nr:thioredoxin [Eggerthellaceae bacterium]
MSAVLSSAEFNEKVLGGTGKVLVDFFATWCGPCRMIAPAIEEIAAEKAGEVEVYKIDIDKSPDIAQQFGIRGVPTLMVFEGGKPVSQMVGAQPKAQILAMLG